MRKLKGNNYLGAGKEEGDVRRGEGREEHTEGNATGLK